MGGHSVKPLNSLPWEVVNAEGVPALLRQSRLVLFVTEEGGYRLGSFSDVCHCRVLMGSLVTGCQSCFKSRNVPNV